jgi:hypothetical protein
VIAGEDCVPDRVPGDRQRGQLLADGGLDLAGQQLQGVHRGQVGHAPGVVQRDRGGGLAGRAYRRGQVGCGPHARVAVQQDHAVGDAGRRGDVAWAASPSWTRAVTARTSPPPAASSVTARRMAWPAAEVS